MNRRVPYLNHDTIYIICILVMYHGTHYGYYYLLHVLLHTVTGDVLLLINVVRTRNADICFAVCPYHRTSANE